MFKSRGRKFYRFLFQPSTTKINPRQEAQAYDPNRFLVEPLIRIPSSDGPHTIIFSGRVQNLLIKYSLANPIKQTTPCNTANAFVNALIYSVHIKPF